MNAVERVLAKHRRALVHLEAFHEAKKAFLDKKPYRLAEEFNSDYTEYTIRAYDVEPVPEKISLIVGDVVHNARACLDHLAWEIAQNPSRRTSFPICLTAPKDRKTKLSCNPTIYGGISSRHQTAVVSAQPYKLSPEHPENAWLAILNHLDITDKHKIMLASVASIHGNVHGRPTGYRGSEPVPEYEWGPLENGAPVARFICSEPSPEMTVQFDLIPDISLNDIGAERDTASAGDVLWHVCEEVRDTVQAFGPF